MASTTDPQVLAAAGGSPFTNTRTCWRATKYPVPGYHPYWKTMYRTPEPWLRAAERDSSAD